MAKGKNSLSTLLNSGDLYPRLNFALIDEKYSKFEDSPFVILPIPYDAATTFKGGAREGPAEIINGSQWVELYDHELGRETHKAGIHTLPEVVPALGSASEMVERSKRITKSLIKSKKTVVALGGDHSVSIGVIQAHLEAYPNLSILQLDAHADLRDSYEDNKLSSATAMRRTFESGGKLVQVGLRAVSEEDVKFAKKNKIPQFWADPGTPVKTEEIIKELGEQVYISLDVDCFDPSIMAATGTPEPGGFYWHEVIKLLRQVTMERKVVGFDVVELSPSLGPHACSFLAAKLVYKLIGYIVTGKK